MTADLAFLGARRPIGDPLPRELLEITEHATEFWKFQSFFLPLIFGLIQRADHRNSCPEVALIWLSDDVIELRNRPVCRPRPVSRMPSDDDVFWTPARLKYSRVGQAVACAVPAHVSGNGPTEAHIFGNVDGDEPVWSVKNFIPNESMTASSQT